ncbi:MAG: type II secretion system protein [Candidatus Eremiobacterota bacterium]
MFRRAAHTTRRGGFSMTELLIAIMILATLSVLLVGVIPASIFGLRSAQQQAGAAMLARGAMDQLRSRGFSRLVLTQSAEFEQIRLENLTYEVIYGVYDPGLPRDPDTDELVGKELIVTVEWPSHQGPRSYTLRQLVPRVP